MSCNTSSDICGSNYYSQLNLNSHKTKDIETWYIKLDMSNIRDIKVDLEFKDPNTGQSAATILQKYKFQRNELVNVIPTAPDDVIDALEYIGESGTIDKEDDYGRRLRLAELLMEDELKRQLFQQWRDKRYKKEITQFTEDEDDEEFYTPASKDLISARQYILKNSIARANKRIAAQKTISQTYSIQNVLNKRRAANKYWCSFDLLATQVVSTRPISTVTFCNNGNYVASGSWNGEVSIIDSNTLEVTQTLQNHDGKVGGIAWTSNDSVLITGGEDHLITVSNRSDGEFITSNSIGGHEGRITDLQVHPSGKFIGTSSFDSTWRLWDIEKQKQLLLQEGHSKELYCLAFQADGSLVSTAGTDKTAIIWDLRSGKAVSQLQGHAKTIYCMDWSIDGHTLATGGGDGVITIWDLRKSDKLTKITEHKSIVTSLKFDKANDHNLISSGYDRSIFVYSKDNYLKVSSLIGHADKVLTFDIDKNNKNLISGGWDRSVKHWSTVSTD